MTTFKRGTIPVVWQRRSFGAVHSRALSTDCRLPTIAEIVAETRDLPRGFDEFGEVRITSTDTKRGTANGEPVPRELWHVTRPRYRPGFDLVISLHMTPRFGGGSSGSSGSSGGGGSSKNPIATIASIAVLLVAAAVSGGALGIGAALGGFFGTSAAVGAAIAGAGIGAGGPLEIDALRPPE